MKLPKISLITVNFNGKRFLKNFFASLDKLTYPNWELIFVDNNSTDDSVGLIKELKDSRIKLIENRKNLGFALANNQAAEIARGKYLFFVNNDTKIESRVLSKLVKEMEENQNLAICGCKMMNYSGQKHFHTGIGVDIFGYPIFWDIWKKIFYIEGSALMIRSEIFRKLGGFDPEYFMFHEDIDLAWRAWLLGYQVTALPSAVIYHFAGGTAGGGEKIKGRYQSSLLRRYYSERNNIRTLLKNYRVSTLLIILPLYFLINLVEILFYLVLLRFKVVYLYLKAYLWNLVNLAGTLKKRREVQRQRVISDRKIISLMYHGSGKLVALKKAGIPRFK
ncbi:hypothetical protein COU96_02900 [Candidatus Shapirobacteria bacterium CG10_big_fil_rev_8_21_14_0_10_38_14]|uniref:Glycosyltransferase 2-like domain-containing protein n=1 Tax=Candidatus Shapirobacteria bacterium CG10_big_fil_rev_8_21_14_0_10_38_14 TaxID=1974483 RepID=A0A2M8L4U6_9BACT|nr:MAG: hypothetical protein COU96_02900 [Candidatus Shapirobacteria bacterium CG10_big_fil_rev_8_21_14_0_10_38_14]